MRGQDGIKEIRHEEVCVVTIGLIHVYDSMYFYYLLLFVIYVLSLDKLGDLLLYLSLRAISCISVELLYVCQTVGIWIGKWCPDKATTDDTASDVRLTGVDNPYKI